MNMKMNLLILHIDEVDNTVEDEGYITSLTLVGSAITATATASIATGAISEIFLNNDGSGYHIYSNSNIFNSTKCCWR